MPATKEDEDKAMKLAKKMEKTNISSVTNKYCKQDYVNIVNNLINYYSKEENQHLCYEYTRKLIEKGITPVKMSKMCSIYPELKELYFHLQQIVKDNYERGVLTKQFDFNYTRWKLKLMFGRKHPELAYSPEELIDIQIKNAQLEEIKANTELALQDIKIGFEDDK